MIKFIRVKKVCLGICDIKDYLCLSLVVGEKNYSFEVDKKKLREKINHVRNFHIFPRYFCLDSYDCDRTNGIYHFMTLNYFETLRVFNQIKKDAEGPYQIYRVKRKDYEGMTFFEKFLFGA